MHPTRAISNSESVLTRPRCALLIALWTVAVALGWWKTVNYEFGVNDGSIDCYAHVWPPDTRLVRAEDRPTLLLFVHPKCPCTTSTLNELERLMATLRGEGIREPLVQLIATVPPNAKRIWWDTSTVEHGTQIAAGNLYVDRAGQEAKRFGANTSGTLLLYDQAGHRKFGGGITVSRGHEGQSTGADCLQDLLADLHGPSAQRPVFGCELCLPNSRVQPVDMTPSQPSLAASHVLNQ
jgi:hypothetical protein